MGSLTSCSLDPVIADEVGDLEITTIQDLQSMIDGSYTIMTKRYYWGRNMIVAGEIRADNTYSNGYSQRFPNWSKMNVEVDNRRVKDLFLYAYSTVANPNIILREALDITDGSPEDVNHLVGEAYAIRAMAHFDLMRLFGQTYLNGGTLGIGYKLEFKGEDNNLARATIEETKSQLYADINKAIEHLTLGKSSSYDTSKIRFNLDAAYALKSRIAIYFKDYDVIMGMASEIEDLINKYPITEAKDLVDYWAQETPGAASIFELAQSTTNNNGSAGIAYIYRGKNYGDVVAFKNIVSQAKFHDGDVRASHAMINNDSGEWRNIGKYPDESSAADNLKLFRVEEVVLNYAEALYGASLANETKALEYLNKIPQKRFIAANDVVLYLNLSGVALRDAILEERRKELLFEGFRLYDLARHGIEFGDIDVDSRNKHGVIKPGDYRLAFPIPRHEMDANRALGPEDQNPGYSAN